MDGTADSDGFGCEVVTAGAAGATGAGDAGGVTGAGAAGAAGAAGSGAKDGGTEAASEPRLDVAAGFVVSDMARFGTCGVNVFSVTFAALTVCAK